MRIEVGIFLKCHLVALLLKLNMRKTSISDIGSAQLKPSGKLNMMVLVWYGLIKTDVLLSVLFSKFGKSVVGSFVDLFTAGIPVQEGIRLKVGIFLI